MAFPSGKRRFGMVVMAMYLRYGSYIHPADEVTISRSLRTDSSQGGEPLETAHTVNINGVILPTSGSELISVVARLRLMERAYSKWFQDLVYYDSTTGAVVFSLLNSLSSRGVRVVQPPSIPADPASGLVTGLNYSITVQAEFPVQSAVGLYKSFNETISIQSGGIVFGTIRTRNRPAIRYVKEQFAPWSATQSGSAVGFLSRPVRPAPIWPGALVNQPSLSLASPQYQGGKFLDWGVQWSYQFESPIPLFGEPHRQPVG